MASQQAAAKTEQGFQQKPVWPICSTCKWFTFDTKKTPVFGGGTFNEQSNLRCSLGGFKVGKTSMCKRHDGK